MLRQRIGTFCADKGLSISAAARHLGVDRTLLSKLASGERTSVSDPTFQALCANSDNYIKASDFVRSPARRAPARPAPKRRAAPAGGAR